jgi:hypothetical protein
VGNRLIVVTPGNGITVQYRAAQGGNAQPLTSFIGTVPTYLMVTRSGSTYSASTSGDGVTWTPIPGSSVTINVTGTLLAGMAVTSHTTAKVSTATFGAVITP